MKQLYRLVTGHANDVEREINELAEEGYRVMQFSSGHIPDNDAVIAPAEWFIRYSVLMELKQQKPKPPTVQIKESVMPAMGIA
jgi:hypothetical protein